MRAPRSAYSSALRRRKRRGFSGLAPQDLARAPGYQRVGALDHKDAPTKTRMRPRRDTLRANNLSAGHRAACRKHGASRYDRCGALLTDGLRRPIPLLLRRERPSFIKERGRVIVTRAVPARGSRALGSDLRRRSAQPKGGRRAARRTFATAIARIAGAWRSWKPRPRTGRYPEDTVARKKRTYAAPDANEAHPTDSRHRFALRAKKALLEICLPCARPRAPRLSRAPRGFGRRRFLLPTSATGAIPSARLWGQKFCKFCVLNWAPISRCRPNGRHPITLLALSAKRG